MVRDPVAVTVASPVALTAWPGIDSVVSVLVSSTAVTGMLAVAPVVTPTLNVPMPAVYSAFPGRVAVIGTPSWTGPVPGVVRARVATTFWAGPPSVTVVVPAGTETLALSLSVTLT